MPTYKIRLSKTADEIAIGIMFFSSTTLSFRKAHLLRKNMGIAKIKRIKGAVGIKS